MQPAQILIVEDETIVAKDLERSLTAWGYAVVGVAASGKDAIAKAAKERPDIVLMDVILKGDMDGVEAAGEIHTRFNIPVVFLTAHGDEDTLERAKLSAPFAYVLKPFDERELHTVIQVVLNRRRLEDRLKEEVQELEDMNQALEENLWALRKLQNSLVTREREAASIEVVSTILRQLGRPLASMGLHVEELKRRGQQYEKIRPLLDKISERVEYMQSAMKEIKSLKKSPEG
jgi:CheY-like chemotaxis protein